MTIIKTKIFFMYKSVLYLTGKNHDGGFKMVTESVTNLPIIIKLSIVSEINTELCKVNI